MEPIAKSAELDAALPTTGTDSDDVGREAPSAANFSRRKLLRGLGGAAAGGSALAVLSAGRADAAPTLVSKQGTISAVDYTKRTVSVLVTGTTVPMNGIPYVGITPSVGDQVNLLQQGTTTYIVGSPLSTNPPRMQKNVVDIVSDYGADPTGKSDDSSRFAQANTDLAAAGGGLIQLRPSSLHIANLSLSPKVSLAGHGFYSRIKGAPAATAPVVTVTSVDGNQIRDLQIVGNRPNGTLGSTANPEIGISVLKGTQPYPLEGLVDNVLIYNTAGDGLRVGPGVLGMMLRAVRTFWTGGRGINVDIGATDGYASDCDVGACVGGDAGIYAAGLQWQWSNCQSYAQGQLISAGVPAWDPNGTAAGWVVGFLQTIYGCHSEDNPVGWKIAGGQSRVRGTSGGDREPVVISSLGPTYSDNDIDVQVFCQDRFVPRNGAELPSSLRNRVFINVNWDSVSSGPHAEAGAIKDQPGFQVFKDQSAGFGSIYNSEYHCNGEDAWVFWQASNGPLTPDLKNGLKHYVVLDANLTINPLVHRGGLPGGRRVSFTFDPGRPSSSCRKNSASRPSRCGAST